MKDLYADCSKLDSIAEIVDEFDTNKTDHLGVSFVNTKHNFLDKVVLVISEPI